MDPDLKARLQFDLRPFSMPPGLRVLVPGWPQARWGQGGRSLVFLGSFLASSASAFWAWGTWVGWVALSFAFFTHVASAVDAVTQSVFPRRWRLAAIPLAAGTLAMFLYAPSVFLLSQVAWLEFETDEPGRGYLVDFRAYRGAAPRQGEWIWMHFPALTEDGAAEVVAVPGQKVEWTGRTWKVDGRDLPLHGTLRQAAWPQTCQFVVPEDQILVEPEYSDVLEPPAGLLVLVPSESVMGRAWARYYPVWDRRLL